MLTFPSSLSFFLFKQKTSYEMRISDWSSDVCSSVRLVPALLATVGIYGLVADPADVGRHVTDLLGAAPGEVRDLAESQLSSITSEASQSVSIGQIGRAHV